MAPIDVLRPPSPLDLQARTYKDWLHVNVFAPGTVAIVNASVHGDPLAPSALAVGTFLVHTGGDDVDATVDVRSRHDPAVVIGASSITIGQAHVGLDDDACVRAAARSGGASIDVVAEPDAVPIEVEVPVPFGSGWISWRAIPRLTVSGELSIGGRDVGLDAAVAYHDHNWGRWRWGDDIGWRWGSFPAIDQRLSVTVAHRTDRQHRRGHPIARVQIGNLAREYPTGTVTVDYLGRRDRPLPRLPGAMAALRTDRQRPDLPACIRTTVDDGFDRLDIEFHVAAAMQLITADPAWPGQTFIHELIGSFTVRGRVQGRSVAAAGLGVFEHVD